MLLPKAFRSQDAIVLDAELIATPADGPLNPPRPCGIYSFDRDEATRAAAKTSTFRCKICSTLMTPVFPAPVKDGRRKSPRPYFRAITQHFAGFPCRMSVQLAAGAGSGVAPGRSARPRAPNRFIDEAITDPRAGSRGRPEPAIDAGTSSGRWAPRIVGTTDGTSTSSVRSVRDLVAAWHASPEVVQSQRLTIPRCSGRSYGTVFRRIDMAAARDLPENAGRFLYWAPARRVEVYASGYALSFSVQSSDQRWLRAFIHRSLDPPTQMVTIAQRLEAAARGERMTVYLLGAFVGQDGRQSLTLEPSSARYVWLEPGDPGPPTASTPTP